MPFDEITSKNMDASESEFLEYVLFYFTSTAFTVTANFLFSSTLGGSNVGHCAQACFLFTTSSVLF